MIMRRLLMILGSLLLSTACYAVPPSFTNVTAALSDASSQTWANASYTVQLVPPFGNPNPLLNNGNAITDSLQTGFANSSGVITLTLDDNAAITPAGSSWKFTLCPNANTNVCSSISVSVTGASQNLSTVLSSQLLPVVVAVNPTISRAYNDAEAFGGQGALYWNTSDNTVRGCIGVCNGTNWVVVAGGSGSSLQLQTDSVNNGSQTLFNAKAGSGMTIVDDGVGGITFSSTGGISNVIAGSNLNRIVAGSVITLNLNNPITADTSGRSGSTIQFVSPPTTCTTGNAPIGVDSFGNALACAPIGGAGSVATYIPLENCAPDGTGNSFYTVASLSNYFNAHWEFITNTAAAIYCQVLIPANVSPSPNPFIILFVASNDGTAGHTSQFQTFDGVIVNTPLTSSINLGPLTASSTANFTTSTTAWARSQLNFPVSSMLIGRNTLVIKIIMTNTGTAPTNNMFVTPYLQINQTL